MTLPLFDDVAPSPHRVEALAGILAGFRWPGRRSLDALKKAQREAALRIAEDALRRLAEATD